MGFRAHLLLLKTQSPWICLNQANNSCHFNNSACVVSLLILKMIYGILYLKTESYCIASLLKVMVNYCSCLSATSLQFWFFNSVLGGNLYIGNIFYYFVFLHIRRRKIHFLNYKVWVGLFWLQQN